MSSQGRVPRRLTSRATRIAAVLVRRTARHGFTRFTNLFRARAQANELVELRHRETATQLAGTLGALKGSAAKLGQLASFLELDFIPAEYRELYRSELASLRDAAPPMAWPTVSQVLEEEWGAAPESLLEDLEQSPAAAASIGQVHRAVLHDGRPVALKVQYPGVAEAISAELRSVALLLPLARGIAPALSSQELAAELRERLTEELDYELEASHQATFASAYAGHPFIHVPEVHEPLTRRRVLVTDWVDGLRFDAVRQLPQVDRNRFSEILYRFYFGAIRMTGRFNADPHPGNYLLRDDGSVAFVDFGSVKVLDPGFLEGTVALLRAGFAGDARRVRDEMARLGFLGRPELVEPRLAMQWLELSSGWMLHDRPVTIDADVVRAQLPLGRDGSFELARRLPDVDLPRDELLFGRLRTSLVAVLAQLRATANWHALAREGLFGEGPRTELGQAESEFLAGGRASG